MSKKVHTLNRILFPVLAIAINCNAQSLSLASRVEVSDAPQLLASASTSDATAVQLLERVVEASGGADAWKSINSSKMRISVTSTNSSTEHEFLLLDDWSSGATKYRRGAVGSGRAPKEHNGQESFNADVSESKKRVREFDQARVIVGSLPAAAAEIILKNSNYIAKINSGSRSTQENICIDIYRKQTEDAPFVREEEWLISKSTGLPVTVDIILPNLSGRRLLFEEFQFKQMTKIDGLTLPGITTMRRPNGSTQQRVVKEFVPNARFDTSAFDREVAQ